MTSEGSAAPERDTPSAPWQSVLAAANALPNVGGTVAISPGLYRETIFLDHASELTAPSGDVTIGDLTGDIVATTTFNVLTWNTHLFGDLIRAPTWQDYERAAHFGEYFGAARTITDLVSLCEVWDEGLFRGDVLAAGIRPLSGYPHWADFTNIKEGWVHCFLLLTSRPAHSGLAMMCQWPLQSLDRVHYNECVGSCVTDDTPDCLSSKGFMGATVVKDGFAIRVYITHTQAGNDGGQIGVRQNQIVQLADRIRAYRAENPSHLVLVMGDFNVIGDPVTPGEPTGQYAFLREQFGALGGRDAVRHAPDGAIYQDPGRLNTLTSFNEMAVYFDKPNHERHDQRLDYIWFFPSPDGKVKAQVQDARRLILTGPTRTQDDFTSDEWSDHYPVRAEFKLLRIQ